MWEPVALPEVPGQIVAVSEPVGERLLVWTSAGLFKLKLGWKLGQRVKLEERLPPQHGPKYFDPAISCFCWRGLRYPMHGACGPGGGVVGAPLPTTQYLRQTVEHDGDCLLLRDITGTVRQVIDQCPQAAAWLVAGFCGWQGQYLLVAHPGSVRLFRFAGSPDGSGALWQRSGDPRQQQVLLRGILDNPDEDSPRLVYADWLEAHGDPDRAAFIRVQCRLAVREQFADVPYGDPDWNQNYELWKANGERWAAELPALPGVGYGFNHAFRGFPLVQCRNPDDVVRHGERIGAATPIEAVLFWRLPPRPLARLLRTPLPERVCWLMIHNLPEGMESGLADWLLSPRAARLRRLEIIDYCADWAAVLRAVVASRHLGRLEKVKMLYSSQSPPEEELMLTLARSPHLPRLRFVTWALWDRYTEVTRAELRQRFPAMVRK